MVKVLFVCMGNICRSPTAQGVFKQHVERDGLSKLINIDSAGTHAYHVGEKPDPRAQRSALERNIDISDQRARKAIESDFENFDYVIAMDNDNYHHLSEICPPGKESKLKRFMAFAPHLDINEVPDPYYGGPKGFEKVLDLIEEASAGLLNEIKISHLT